MDEKPYEVATRESGSPAELMMKAVAGGMDIDKIKQMMDLQERWEANQARKAYTQAMAAFKAEPLTVAKDKVNTQYKSKYASEGSLLNTVNPVLSKHGLSSGFEFDQTDGLKITCTLTHSGGHKESVSLKGPLDTSGQKNPLQQIKSTITYLRKATFEAVTGIASSDDAGDDDGAGATEYINEKQVSTITDLLNEKGVKDTRLLKYLEATSVETILAADFQKAVAAIAATPAAKGSGGDKCPPSS